MAGVLCLLGFSPGCVHRPPTNPGCAKEREGGSTSYQPACQRITACASIHSYNGWLPQGSQERKDRSDADSEVQMTVTATTNLCRHIRTPTCCQQSLCSVCGPHQRRRSCRRSQMQSPGSLWGCPCPSSARPPRHLQGHVRPTCQVRSVPAFV